MRTFKRTTMMPNETETGQPDEIPLSTILRRVVDSEDLDTCKMVADTINTYIDFIRRANGRTELMADDMMRLFTILRIMLGAMETEQSFARMRGVPMRKAPEVVK